MSTDVITLGIGVDSTGVDKGRESLDKLTAAGARAEASSKKLTSATELLNKAYRGFVGLAATGISVALFVDLTKQSIAFDNSLRKLSTQLGDATEKVGVLEKASKNLALQFGTKAIEQSAAFYEILSVGITDTTKATDLLTQANKLAIGGNASLMTSVDGLTSIMKGYGEAAGTAEEISDSLFVASLAGKISIEELGRNLGDVVPVAKAAGVNLDVLGASIATLTLGGINAAESVTGMKSILTSIISPSAEATKLSKDLGLEFNLTGLQAKGLAGFLQDVITKTGGSTETIAKLFNNVRALVPVLALTADGSKELNGVLEQMTNKAGIANEKFDTFANSPGMKIDRFMASINQIGLTLGGTLSGVLAPAAELAAAALNKLFGLQGETALQKQSRLVDELASKLESMTNKTHIPIIGSLFNSKKDFDLVEYQLESAKQGLLELQTVEQSETETKKDQTDATLKATKAAEELAAKIAKESEARKTAESAAKKHQSAVESFMSALIKEADSIGKNSGELRRLEAARLGVLKTADPLISKIEKENRAIEIQSIKTNEIVKDLQEYKRATDNAMTNQDRYEAEIANLDRLKSLTNGAAISQETYNRNVAKARDELEKTVKTTRTTTNEVDQLWTQAGRNIQSTLANSIFNFFDDGLKGMVKNVGIAVGRIASEFAALRVAQAVGLGSMFGGGSAIAGGIGGTGTAAGVGSALNFASLGSSALSFAKGGFGMPGLVGRGLSTFGGSVGSFGSGLAGGTAGVFSNAGGAGTAFIGGPGTALGGSGLGGAATAGASFAPVAAGLAGAGIGLFGGSMIAGDKKLAGMSGTQTAAIGTAIGFAAGGPIGAAIGGLVAGLGNALFGHGPMKFRQQSLQGSAGKDGFEGDISNVFRAKGGLLVGNKHKTISEQLSTDVQDSLDTAINGFYGSAHTFAKNLGLDVNLVDGFSQQIQIKSEKNEQLTEEAITAMIVGIGTSLASNVLPIIDTLRKAGETSFDTLSRLNAEFVSLTGAVQNLGATTEYAKGLIMALSFEQRTQLVDMAGGVESLAAMTGKFFQNFLSPAEQLALKTDQLNSALIGLGVSTSLSVDDFKELVQALGTSNELRIGLLSIQDDYLAVRNAQQQLGVTTNVLAKAERSLNDIRNELLGKYNQERSELESTISKFKGISDKLKDFRQSLLFGELSPLTPEQKLDQARQQLNQTRLQAAAGDEAAFNKLPDIANTFLQASQVYNASGAAYVSDFNMVQNILDQAQKAAGKQVDVATQQLEKLKSSVDYLLNIDTTTKTTNDLIKTLIDATLAGSGNQQYSTAEIKGYLASNPGLSPNQVAESATRYGVSGDQLRAAGYDTSLINKAQGGSSLSDKTILDFVNANRNDPMAIYQAAVKNGVSSTRLSSVTGVSLTDINKWVTDNGVPEFGRGTNFVNRTGLAMVHRAEAIVPSTAIDEIKMLRQEVVQLRKDANQQTGAMIKVIDITNRQNAQVISGAVSESTSKKSWSERNEVRIA